MGHSAITLIDELRKHKGKIVMIGARSSFFFIGPSEEAIEDIDTVGIMAKMCVSLVSNKCLKRIKRIDIRNRKVVKTYVRSHAMIDSAEEIIILIDGVELGAFWTRSEYLSGKRVLEASIRKIGR